MQQLGYAYIHTITVLGNINSTSGRVWGAWGEARRHGQQSLAPK
jgi:hypothetical protein